MLGTTVPDLNDLDWVTSFGIATAAVTGVGVGIGVGWAVSPVAGVIGGLVAALALGMAFHVAPRRTIRWAGLYNRLARAYSRRASHAVMAVCYHLVVLPARLGSRGLRLAPEGESSGWAPRELEHEGPRGFVAWTSRHGELWYAAVLPYVAVLRALEARSEGEQPSGIYTLF